MARIIQIITLLFLSFLMMSASCDKGTEGCTDSNACNYDETAAINDNSCWFASEGCDCENPPDCEVVCGGEAVEDACGVCIGGTTGIGDSWRINIILTATLKNKYETPLEPDTSSVVIGASINALDGWNIYEGDCPDNSTSCYSDVTYQPGSPSADGVKFYFPHPDWEDDIFTDITDIRQDIRLNDLHLLFSNGMLWEAQLETYTSTNIIDSLSLEFIYLENIETCQIELEINGEELEIDPFENKIEMKVDFNGIIPIKIKVSEICFL